MGKPAEPEATNFASPPSPADCETWRFALESAALGVWDADLAANTIAYSPTWKRMLGYEPHELDDHPDLWLSLIHPDDRERAIESGERHLLGQTAQIETEFRLRHKNGEWLWVLDRGRIVARDASGRPTRMIGVQTDITRQKQAAHQLHLMNERVEIALDAGGVGIWHFEPETGRVVWDRRMREIYGIGPGPDEVAAETWNRLLHPDDAAEAERLVAETLATGTPMKTSYRIVVPGGEIRHVCALARLVRGEGMAPRLVGSIWNITEQVLNGAALAAEKEWLRTTLHSIGDAVVSIDAADRVRFANPAAERLLQLDEASITGRPLRSVCGIVDEDTGRTLECSASAAIREGRTVDRAENAALRRGDGSQRSIRELASPVHDTDGKVVGAVLVMQDVTEVRATQREVEYAARHDALTGLLNRATFEKSLTAAIGAASPSCPLALVYADLDRFKVINDTAGHAAGDALLKLVARSIRLHLPQGATTGRLGGDEFAAFFPAESRDAAAAIAARLVAGLRDDRLEWAGRTYEVQASVGVAFVDVPTAAAETVFAQADAACFAAKDSGRNRSSVYVDGLGAAQRNIAEIRAASELTDALAQGRLLLFGQEIRDLERPDAPLHVEVLCRMLGADGTVVQPGRFIPAAERFGLMGMLDRWIIENTLRQFGAGLIARPGIRVALNLSANSLGDPDLWRFVRDCCRLSDVNPSSLAFEITETAAISNFDAADHFVREARRAGCEVSLDDFGSGLSSFAYLKRFPIDHIKIDGVFIDGLAGSRFNQAVVASISTLAKELRVDVIAERIEDPASVDVLKSLGVRYGQGYLFDRPKPLAQWLGTRPAARIADAGPGRPA